MYANLETKKIEMTKTESKAAGKYGTAEYNELMELMKSFPSFPIEIKASPKRKSEFKGLDYNYMTTYIKKCNRDNKNDIMEEFNTLIAKDKKDKKEGSEYLNAASYLEVKEWFLATFPEIKKFREEHQNKVKQIIDKAAAN